MRMKISLVVGLMAALIIPAVFIVAARSGEVTEMPEGPVYGRETALQYILANYPELNGLENPSKIRTPWEEENLTPKGWAGSSTLQYSKGEWTIRVSNAVVRFPVYTVEVEFTGDSAFYWKGTVDQYGNVNQITYARWHIISPTEM